MNNIQQEYMNDFFQVFAESVVRTLSKSLDTDVCKKIQFLMTTLSTIQNAESYKDGKAIYKVDFATGNRQGALIVLIPEILIAAISDILTGGTGQGVYRGSLSEIEVNSILNILEKVFKDIEATFKKNYERNLVFSANAVLLLKENDNYEIHAVEGFSDFLINYNLTLNEGEEYEIDVLANLAVIEQTMDDLGFSKANDARKSSLSSLDINCLSDVKINVTAELGRTRVPMKYALELIKGSLVELDTQNNSDIKIFANGVEFAYAQIVAVGENFGLKITKIVSKEERMDCI